MLRLRISSSSDKNLEESQAPALATLHRVPRDTVVEPSSSALSLVGAFSIMATGNKDIIIPGYEHLPARFRP